jgi:hypothetical protein
VALAAAHSLAPGGAAALLHNVFDLSFVILSAATVIVVRIAGAVGPHERPAISMAAA